MSSPLLWGPNNIATNLESGIIQSGGTGPSLLSGTVDPSSVATTGVKGSLYQNSSTGIVYRKTDNGSSTNWVALSVNSPVVAVTGLANVQSIPNTTYTTVNFDTPSIDTNSALTGGTFTAPVAGNYMVNVSLSYDQMTGYYYVNIAKNGAIFCIEFLAADVSYNQTINAATIVNLVAGDTITVQAYQASAGAHNLLPGVASTYMAIALISPGSAGAGGSGIARSISSISSPTTAGATASTDYVYLVSGTTTLTLPTAVGNTNLYTVKNTGVATVTIATTGGQTIDGSASATLPVANTSITLVSDNADWRIV